MRMLLFGALFGLLSGLAIAIAALFGVWWERKVAGRIQMRFGPLQAGPVGLLRPEPHLNAARDLPLPPDAEQCSDSDGQAGEQPEQSAEQQHSHRSTSPN